MRHEAEEASGEAAPQAEMERIRQGLERFPQNLVEWETTCLKNVADLLDGLQVARSEWEKFSSRIGEMRSALEAAKLELSEAREEIDRLKGQRDELETDRIDDAARTAAHASELVELQEKIDRAEAARTAAATALEETRSECEILRAERDRLAQSADEARAEVGNQTSALRAEAERLAAENADLLRARDDLEARLAKAERERDLLAEAGRAQGQAQTDLKETRRRLEGTQREIERLRKEAEHNTLMMVEHRGRADHHVTSGHCHQGSSRCSGKDGGR